MSFDWLKNYMPRSLYGRAALILLLPIVVLQLVVSVVFVRRHFEDVTVQMSDAVAREIELVLSAPSPASKEILQMTVQEVPPTTLQEPDRRRWYDFSGIVVIRRLSELMEEIKVIDLYQDNIVRLVVKDGDTAREIIFDRGRISASNPHQLIVNMVFFGLVFTVISMLYLRNQLRPIKRLAAASEAFGRGRHIPFNPTGAIEVRAAGAAFVDMRARIERQIETRTLMLSGVSHDLRTPLTRMRLALSMLDDEDRLALEKDVDEMQRMVDAFLDFTKGVQGDEAEEVDVMPWVRQVIADVRRAGHDVTLLETSAQGKIMLRADAMRRALDNLISNAVRYGNRVEVSVHISEKSLRLRVEDDGPGIARERRAEAQRPFTRLDAARNQDKGGSVGLGLAIAADISRAHGGILRLGESVDLGGLRADIVIAR